MSSYPLSIVTYDRGERWNEPTKKKPFHWAFFIKTGSTAGEGRAYQLRGMPGSFYYPGEEAVNVNSSGSKNGELEIGAVPVDKYDRFKQLIAAAPIKNDESSSWNCQDWSLAVLDWLRQEGFISDGYTNDVIKYWLREDK